MSSAFAAARSSLSATAVLDHPAADAELSLATDASATHIGAVIQQKRPGLGWRPLGFFSAQLDKAQANYSAFDRELLAVVEAIKHFRYMLEGRSFAVFTDHKPLVGALGRRSDPWSARQQWQLSFIAEFAPSIRHIAGQSNVVAEALSRPAAVTPPSAPQQPPLAVVTAANGGPGEAGTGSTGIKAPSGSPVPPASAGPPAAPPPVDLVALATAQASCPDCQRAASSSSLRVAVIQMQGVAIMVDTSSGVFRPLVPASFRRAIFDAIHNLAHPGIRATRRLIASRFVWPCLASQVASWCRDCQQCQRAKVTKQPAAAPQDIANPVQRFSHLHIDLVGPLPQSREGYTHLLTVLDRSTRWAEALPLKSTAAESCATALVAGWVARFGCLNRSPLTGAASFALQSGIPSRNGWASSHALLPPVQRRH
jgi:hypothetical protein